MTHQTMAPTLRLATPDDAQGVLEIYAPIVRETTISFELEVPSSDEMARRITTTLSRHPWLVATDDHQHVLGYAYAGTHRSRAAYQWSCEVSVYIHPDAHRRGIASLLYRALFEILALQGFGSIFAGITQPNAKSVALHRAMGFEPVGVYRNIGFKFGRWCDVEWWQQSLTLTERSGDLPPPRPLADILGDRALAAEIVSICSRSD